MEGNLSDKILKNCISDYLDDNYEHCIAIRFDTLMKIISENESDHRDKIELVIEIASENCVAEYSDAPEKSIHNQYLTVFKDYKFRS